MKKITLFVALLLSLAITTSAQNSGFSYQAVVRNTKGETVANSKVLMRMSLSVDETVYYQEIVETTTNAYGNVSIIVGESKNVVKGSFESVPWETLAVMMKTEIDVTGKGDKYIDYGSVQINPVPYAYYAAKTSNVITATSNNGEPIFCVKDKEGNIVFAVYNDSVVTYINTTDNGSKASKSAFAVRGRSGAKGEEVDLFNIDNNGTTIYIDDENDSKAAHSAFAVRGRSGAKDETNYLSINSDGTTVYIDADDSKASKSAFAVRGRSGAKGEADDVEMMSISGEGTTVYIDTEDSKAAKSAFAVRGRSGAKGEDDVDVINISDKGTIVYIDESDSKAAKSAFAVRGRSGAKNDESDYININLDGTTVYIDTDDSKASKSAFAVRGRSGAKGEDDDLDMISITDKGTTVYIDEGDGKASKSAFAVRGRSGAKDGDAQYMTISTDSTRFYVKDNDENANGFAVVGQNTQEQIFAVDKKNVTINSSMYVNGNMQTSTGSVDRIGSDGSKYFLGLYQIKLYDVNDSTCIYWNMAYGYTTNDDNEFQENLIVFEDGESIFTKEEYLYYQSNLLHVDVSDTTKYRPTNSDKYTSSYTRDDFTYNVDYDGPSVLENVVVLNNGTIVNDINETDSAKLDAEQYAMRKEANETMAFKTTAFYKAFAECENFTGKDILSIEISNDYFYTGKNEDEIETINSFVNESEIYIP